jgi:hypothetical protein
LALHEKKDLYYKLIQNHGAVKGPRKFITKKHDYFLSGGATTEERKNICRTRQGTQGKKPDFLIVVVLILQFTLHPGNVQCKPLLKYGS